MEWKDFTKEQPEQKQHVIAAEKVAPGEYHYFIATYNMGNFFYVTQAVSSGSNGKIRVSIDGRLENVTHWMPVPEVPNDK